ncbi:MAG: hypothetical protein MHPSP_000479, partial [Paramarteilia canceri]
MSGMGLVFVIVSMFSFTYDCVEIKGQIAWSNARSDSIKIFLDDTFVVNSKNDFFSISNISTGQYKLTAKAEGFCFTQLVIEVDSKADTVVAYELVNGSYWKIPVKFFGNSLNLPKNRGIKGLIANNRF